MGQRRESPVSRLLVAVYLLFISCCRYILPRHGFAQATTELTRAKGRWRGTSVVHPSAVHVRCRRVASQPSRCRRRHLFPLPCCAPLERSLSPLPGSLFPSFSVFSISSFVFVRLFQFNHFAC
ncbi:uncharacterized protein DS421_17g594200 [Arachis hypogaea]|nr:uncharacterized protein DS421_17g594200 [Arachis hypogaea]